MTAQPQLGVPALDDNMELASSPFQHAEDFDIDFDQMDNPDAHSTTDNAMDYPAESGDVFDDVMQGEEEEDLLEDENMLEEVDQAGQRQDGHDFDMDGPHQDEHHRHEPDHDNDDEILYDEDEEAPASDATPQIGEVHDSARDGALDLPARENQADDTQPKESLQLPEESWPQDDFASHAQDDSATAPVAAPETENFTGVETYYPDGPEDNDDTAHVSSGESESMPPTHSSEEDLAAKNPTPAPLADSPNFADIVDDGAVHVDDLADQKPLDNPHDGLPVDAAQELSESEENDKQLVEDSAIQEALLDIRVDWLGREYPLFSPLDGDASQSFVHDTALAYEPLNKLLSECHPAVTLDLGISDELVLDIDVLGLHICEDSKYAAQISLAQVVEVYLLLKRNEVAEHVEPMPCRFSSRVCLETQYNYLRDAAFVQRRPFSSIVSEHTETPGPELGEPNDLEASADAVEHEEAEGEDLAVLIDEDAAAADLSAVDQGTTDVQVAAELEEPAAARDGESEGGNVQNKLDTIMPVAEGVHVEDESSLPEDNLLDVFDGEPEPVATESLEPDISIPVEDSNSSHTLEREFQSGNTQDDESTAAYEEHLEYEGQPGEIPYSVDETEGDFAEQAPAEDENEYDFYNSDQEPLETQAEDAGTEFDGQAPTASDEPIATEGKGSPANANGDANVVHNGNVALHASYDDVDVAVPATPQRSSSAKRKIVEEEDDLLDLGLDTPEPKRPRPS